jgi:hypothetical protein
MATSISGDGEEIDMRRASSNQLLRRRRRKLAVLFFGTLTVSACLVVFAGEKRKMKK